MDNFEPTIYTTPSTFTTTFEIEIRRQSISKHNATIQLRCENLPNGVNVEMLPRTLPIFRKSTIQITITTFRATPDELHELTINIYERLELLASFPFNLKIATTTITRDVRPRPFLLFQLDNTYPTQDYKQQILADYINESNVVISKPIEVPAKWGSWELYFVCKDGTPLEYDENNSTHFYCPSEQLYYSDEPYASSWIGFRHNQLARQARDLGIAYHYTRNISYANAATEILAKYASFYPNLPVKIQLIRFVSYQKGAW